jgi:hypothetical protein
MKIELLLQMAERVLFRRPPRVISATFYSVSTTLLIAGFLRGTPAWQITTAVAIQVAIALAALGLRHLEGRVRAPKYSDRQ